MAPPGFGPGESTASAALDNWCAANPLLSKEHLKERELLETAACRAYSAKSLEWWEERVNSGVAGPEGARALERMLPYWEAHASFGDEHSENAAQVLHVLAVEYANWARHHRDTSGAEGEGEM